MLVAGRRARIRPVPSGLAAASWLGWAWRCSAARPRRRSGATAISSPAAAPITRRRRVAAPATPITGTTGPRHAQPRYAPQQEAPRQFYWPWEDRPQPVAPQPERTYRAPASAPQLRHRRKRSDRPPRSSAGSVPLARRRPPKPAVAKSRAERADRGLRRLACRPPRTGPRRRVRGQCRRSRDRSRQGRQRPRAQGRRRLAEGRAGLPAGEPEGPLRPGHAGRQRPPAHPRGRRDGRSSDRSLACPVPGSGRCAGQGVRRPQGAADLGRPPADAERGAQPRPRIAERHRPRERHQGRRDLRRYLAGLRRRPRPLRRLGTGSGRARSPSSAPPTASISPRRATASWRISPMSS